MRAFLLLSCCGVLWLPTPALAWSPLRAPNPNVEKGNALMAEEQYEDALDAYDEAARELPQERGVQLNRGLALLSQGLIEPAKEAFTAAADPSTPPEIRADAYYDLGIAHAREGEVASDGEDFEQSSAHFREAADAFKRALRLRPGDRNAAWNLEYALDRIREEEQKQEQEQEEQEQEQQESESESESESDSESDSEDQNESESDNESEDESDSEDESESENENDSENQDQGENQSQDQNESESEPQPEDTSEPEMQRSEVERFLDALEQNEESLPLQRARRRSAGRRPPEKDW